MSTSSAAGHPYQRLAANIAAQIARGELKPGDQIPSVRSLANTYGVTTATAQKAVDQLRNDGYAKTVPGLGIFVAEQDERADAQPATVDTVIQQLDELQTMVADLADRVHRLENPPARP